jgi:hypothetical protein
MQLDRQLDGRLGSRTPHLQTMHASFPPSSICSGTIPALRLMAMPVSPPVNEMQLTEGWVVR